MKCVYYMQGTSLFSVRPLYLEVFKKQEREGEHFMALQCGLFIPS